MSSFIFLSLSAVVSADGAATLCVAPFCRYVLLYQFLKFFGVQNLFFKKGFAKISRYIWICTLKKVKELFFTAPLRVLSVADRDIDFLTHRFIRDEINRSIHKVVELLSIAVSTCDHSLSGACACVFIGEGYL